MASATRVLVLALCFSLGFPLISDAMQASARTINADATLHVWQRLNSPERQAAIARAAEIDKAAREAFAAQEAGATSGSAAVSAQASANIGPAHTSAERHSRAGGGDRKKGGNPDFLNDPQQYFMQRGLNYGLGLANSAAEGLFLGVMDSPYEKPAPASTP